MNHIKHFSEFSESLKYHLANSMPITENVFRPGSEKFFSVLEEARNLFDEGVLMLEGIDKELYETTEIGSFGDFEGKRVPLDIPMEIEEEMNEAEYKGREVELNKPKRGGTKKYHVYVKNPKTGKIKKIAFGDVHGGLTSKVNDPDARKSFVARHNCKRNWKPSDKLSAAYWSCRLPKFKHLVNTTYNGYW